MKKIALGVLICAALAGCAGGYVSGAQTAETYNAIVEAHVTAGGPIPEACKGQKGGELENCVWIERHPGVLPGNDAQATTEAQRPAAAEKPADAPQPVPVLPICGQCTSSGPVIQGLLDKLVGKTVYKTGGTHLLPADTTIEAIKERLMEEAHIREDDAEPLSLLTMVSPADLVMANMTPLKIVDAKLADQGNVLIKVQLPNGTFRLLRGVAYGLTPKDEKWPGIAEEVTNFQVWSKIPKKFTKREIAAIKDSSIYRGMSEEALYWVYGFPQKTNDYGLGGKQLVYFHGKSLIYVRNGVVSDWQEFE